MSTTETAVADDKTGKRSLDERAAALGPGVLRLPDGRFLIPEEATIGAMCLGPLAHWSVSCRYAQLPVAKGSEPLLFLFPLPPEASLLRLSIEDQELLPGELTSRALTDLPDSVEKPVPSESLLAAFGDETLPILSLDLEHWREKFVEGSLTIALEYASGLPTVDGRIRLTCPTAYSVEVVNTEPTHFHLAVCIEDGDELVDDPESSVALTSSKEGETQILQGSFEHLENDVTVTFRPGRTQMPVTRLRRSEQHFIFSIFPPTSIPASPQRRDIVFAVDASENLDPILYEKVKSDLMGALRTLDENDRFALVTFGRDIEGYDGGEFCDIDQVEEACKWLEGSRPQGRADVQPLLQRIQSLPSQGDRQLCVFLLAAGHVGNEPSILKSLDFDQSDRRYYTVGIGPTVKQSFLRRLALLTRGRCEVSTDGRCAAALKRLLGQTRALLAEVTFEDLGPNSGVDESQLVPSRMTSLTAQGPVHCLGKGDPSSLRFRSKDETGVFFAGTVNAQPTENPALAGVWAGLRVRELLDSVKLTTGAKRKALRAEATEIAAEHGILTEDTVLVWQTNDGVKLQYSAQPSSWRGTMAKEKQGNVSNKEGAAPFDWRKGLVAREGLFQGSKSSAGSDPGESSGRYGLRSKGGGSSGDSSAKPRLDRITSEHGPHEEFLEEPEESPEVEPAMESAPLPAAEKVVAAPISVPTTQPHVVHLHGDPLAEGRLRLDAYRGQLETFDTELALGALQGLPRELSPTGGELPRILAQTVAHLEKRGYFSHAVSVLGLLLRDNPTPEVTKKMETLLGSWADSLGKHQIPEAIQVLQLGQRVCGGSNMLAQKCDRRWAQWKDISGEQGSMPAISRLKDAVSPADLGLLFSQPQVELARVQEKQSALAERVDELTKTVQSDLSALSENLKESIAHSVQSVLSEALGRVVEETVAGVVARTPQVAPSSPVAPAVAEESPQVRAFGEETEQVESAPSQAVGEPPQSIESPGLAGEDSIQELEPPEPEPISYLDDETEIGSQAESPRPTAPQGAESVSPQRSESFEIPLPPVESTAKDEELQLEQIFLPGEKQVEHSIPARVLSRDELTELLLAEPRGAEAARAVEASLSEPKERINFFRDLVKADKSEPYHSLSLARAYRTADQTKVAVVHYQKYLRSEKEPQAYLELAEAYDELGKANLSASARKAAEAYGG